MMRLCALLMLVVLTASQAVGQEMRAAGAVAVSDSLAAVERARLHLQIREFAEAYEAAEEAAAEAGLQPASTNLVLPDSFDATTVPTILLYRGLSLELQRQFPEAVADYFGFLRLESSSQRSRELRKRLPYVEAQSVRTLARRWRDEGIIPPPEAYEGGGRYSVGVFPLFNESSLLAMSQMAFGLTGVLKNVISVLNSFSDVPLPTVPYVHVRWLLDEVLPQEAYADPESVPASELARVIDSDYLVVGRLNEVVGSLTANLTVGRAVSATGTQIAEVQSSYSQAGLLSLQLELALAVADSIQAMTGFVYTPSREAFADSIQHYLIPDVDQFFDYGYAMEQVLIGDPAEGRIFLMDNSLPVAQRDLSEVAEMFSGETPPEDNIFELTATTDELAVALQTAYEDSVAAAVAAAAEADSILATRRQPTEFVQPVRRSRRTAQEVIVVSATAGNVLGTAGVGMPRLDVFQVPGFPSADPRAGKSGTLDPTRTTVGVPIRVEIPVPRQAPSSSSER